MVKLLEFADSPPSVVVIIILLVPMPLACSRFVAVSSVLLEFLGACKVLDADLFAEIPVRREFVLEVRAVVAVL